jgi:type II secretory pathway predicted ATPase ExeA/DNA-binding response OmpR family regulator
MDNVLILSGDADHANTLKSRLDNMHQFAVSVVNQGAEAIGLFEKIKFSVFITDISPPDMDALDLLSYMSQHHPNIPCIIMTDHGKPWFKEQMAKQSFLYHLEKPFKINSLASAIIVGLSLRDEGKHFQGMTMSSVLPLIEILQKTCRMEAKASEQNKGYLYFNKGVLIDAHYKDLRREAAAREIAKWTRISIKFTELPERRTRTRVKTELMDIAGACWDKNQVICDPPGDDIPLSPEKNPIPMESAEEEIPAPQELLLDELSMDDPKESVVRNKAYPTPETTKINEKYGLDNKSDLVESMYLEYFQLAQKPFQINTDPSFLWFGEKQKEALSTLEYGLQENKSFLLLTGDVGVGKTTIVKAFLRGLGQNDLAVVIHNPVMERLDFFNYVARAFGLSGEYASKGAFLDAFGEFLLTSHYKGKRVLLIIDECQLLDSSLLNEIRLFLNFEKKGNLLINVFFVGQLEFNTMLLQPENRAVRQRIAVNYNIPPLSLQETEKYIEYRLAVAGNTRKIFKGSAIREIFNYSKGYPRLINIIADRSLLTGFINSAKYIKKSIIKECAGELHVSLKS